MNGVRRAWIAAGSIAFALAGLSCGDAGLCENSSQVEIPSPDGSLAAWVFIRGCGATTLNSVHVSVTPAGSAPPEDSGNVFILEPVTAVAVKWPAERELSISRDPGGGKVLKQESRVGEVAVTYAIE
jgi:hypothetical protein